MADAISLEGHRALTTVMHRLRGTAPPDIPAMVSEVTAPLGLREVTVHLADIQQRWLVPLPNPRAPAKEPLPIDATLPGWCYRTTSTRTATAPGSGLQLWLPVIDGIERMGVLEVQCERLDAPTLLFCRALADLLALIVPAKGAQSDEYTDLRRRRPMKMSAEMVWAFLPPGTLTTPRVTSSAVLEPAYDLGGDAFDHCLIGDMLHATILDAMGHDLRSGLTSSVALAEPGNPPTRCCAA